MMYSYMIAKREKGKNKKKNTAVSDLSDLSDLSDSSDLSDRRAAPRQRRGGRNSKMCSMSPAPITARSSGRSPV